MQTKQLTIKLDYDCSDRLSDYKSYLYQEGRSKNTIIKCVRDLRAFLFFVRTAYNKGKTALLEGTVNRFLCTVQRQFHAGGS